MPCLNSQCAQDLFVLAALNKKRDGTFVEIGSNDAVTINNTYVLESEFGWRGVMVEYDPVHLASYLEKTHEITSRDSRCY
jgi:hypothetical protein